MCVCVLLCFFVLALQVHAASPGFCFVVVDVDGWGSSSDSPVCQVSDLSQIPGTVLWIQVADCSEWKPGIPNARPALSSQATHAPSPSLGPEAGALSLSLAQISCSLMVSYLTPYRHTQLLRSVSCPPDSSVWWFDVSLLLQMPICLLVGWLFLRQCFSALQACFRSLQICSTGWQAFMTIPARGSLLH